MTPPLFLDKFNGMKRGFSLVELSIVLVILGLLVGGVLSGQSLIRAAQWRKTMVDVQNIGAAVGTFRDKYFALPGDMPNATAFWGAADGSTGLTAACPTSGGTTVTCNGNGDGTVGGSTMDATTGPESYRFWQHLNNAALYPNNLTGTPRTGTTKTLNWDSVIGTNVPASPLDSSVGYEVSNWASAYGSSNYRRQLTLHIAKCCYTDAMRASLEGASIKPEEVWNLDTKIDDGKPRFGNVQIYGNGYGSCMIDTSNYDLATSSKTCEAIIGLGY
jgi:prepilin-type N-terminal cleavage/methylation domain-containing protein